MANVASAEKRNRQNIKRRTRNLIHLRPMRTYVKRAIEALESKDAEKIKAAVKLAVRYIDLAAQKGVIEKATAARKISRLTRQANRTNRPA